MKRFFYKLYNKEVAVKYSEEHKTIKNEIEIFNYSVFLSIIGCSSVKQNKASQKERIIYVVPDTVQNWFKNVINDKNIRLEKNNLYFILHPSREYNKIYYDLFLCNSEDYNSLDNFLVKNSNHAVYIDGELYPLLNSLDQIFSTRDYSNKELLELLKEKKKIKQYYKIYEKTYWVTFDNKWKEIITTSDESEGGYQTNSPNKTNFDVSE